MNKPDAMVALARRRQAVPANREVGGEYELRHAASRLSFPRKREPMNAGLSPMWL